MAAQQLSTPATHNQFARNAQFTCNRTPATRSRRACQVELALKRQLLIPKTRPFIQALPWQHGAFQWWQAGCCSEVAQTGYSFLLIQLLTVLSTYVQSLEHSIQGSTKLGLVKLISSTT